MKNILFILLAFLSVSFRLYAQDVIKIGIIGLDIPPILQLSPSY